MSEEELCTLESLLEELIGQLDEEAARSIEKASSDSLACKILDHTQAQKDKVKYVLRLVRALNLRHG